MSTFWNRLFGRKTPTPAAPARDDATLAALIAPHAAPALQLLKSAKPARSHFGGAPLLPPDIPWPMRGTQRLALLARLSLAELNADGARDWLPRTGALLFFYDIHEQPWGFDPKDRAGHCVLYVPDLDTPVPPLSGATSAEEKPYTLPQRTIECRAVPSFPSYERAAMDALALSDAEWERVMELSTRAFGAEPQHQLGGYPDPIQGDEMELECQLASNGIYVGDAKGYADPRGSALKAGAARWRLLLQLDTDESLDMHWGDGGRLYLWIDESAARAGRFNDTWAILQCH